MFFEFIGYALLALSLAVGAISVVTSVITRGL